MMVIVIALAWMSFVWEKATGLTFVLSKSTRAVGQISTANHLAGTFRIALGATAACGVVLFLTRSTARGKSAQSKA